MDECFICMEELVKVYCSSCHKTIGEKCFRRIKSCPFCRSSPAHNPRQQNDRLKLIGRKNFIKRINQKLEEFTEEIENESRRDILSDSHSLSLDVNLGSKIEGREKHLYQIRINALIKQGRIKEKEEKRRRIEKQIGEKEKEIQKLTSLLARI